MIVKINKRYTMELIQKFSIIKNNKKDKKDKSLIKYKRFPLFFLYLTEKGIANLGTILPLQFKYLKARSLCCLSNLFIPSNHSFLLITSKNIKLCKILKLLNHQFYLYKSQTIYTSN